MMLWCNSLCWFCSVFMHFFEIDVSLLHYCLKPGALLCAEKSSTKWPTQVSSQLSVMCLLANLRKCDGVPYFWKTSRRNTQWSVAIDDESLVLVCCAANPPSELPPQASWRRRARTVVQIPFMALFKLDANDFLFARVRNKNLSERKLPRTPFYVWKKVSVNCKHWREILQCKYSARRLVLNCMLNLVWISNRKLDLVQTNTFCYGIITREWFVEQYSSFTFRPGKDSDLYRSNNKKNALKIWSWMVRVLAAAVPQPSFSERLKFKSRCRTRAFIDCCFLWRSVYDAWPQRLWRGVYGAWPQ